MESILAIIITGLVCLLAGIIAGILVYSRRKQEPSRLEEQLKECVRSAAGDAVQKSQEILLTQAKLLVENAKTVSSSEMQKQSLEMQKTIAPLQNVLSSLSGELKKMEESRAQEYGKLGEQLREVSGATQGLKDQTGNLLQALKAPQIRGQWGELQLKRAVEFAGMTNCVDFYEQVSTSSSEGDLLRPDMTIRLPNDRVIVVDSKAPMEAYLRALEAKTPEERKGCLEEHAAQLKKHFKQLGQKQYWQQFERSPEFVVLFLHSESLLSAALESSPEILEASLRENILIATPTSLIALLKAVAYGWKEAQVAQKAKEVVALGNELIERFATVAGYWREVGGSLEKAVEKYNQAVASTQSRLMPTARKLGEAKDLEEIATINTLPTKQGE
jgi:DNA recombination protein RmuC